MWIRVWLTMLAVLCSLLLLSGCAFGNGGSSYDYSASVDCLAEPLDPQYGGGLVGNPSFDSGLAEWTPFGGGKVETRRSNSGNSFMVSHDRNLRNESFSQNFCIRKGLLYTFSAWLQLNKGKGIVSAFLEIPGRASLIVGSVIAKSGCWSMLKGGFSVDEDTKVKLYFLSNKIPAEIWIDSVSLKPFTRKEWQGHQKKSIQRIRKRQIRIHVTMRDGQKLEGVNITVSQMRPHFLIGCGTTESILSNKVYQDWFTRRFLAATFNNEMKWYYTEVHRGSENYSVPDAMVSFFRNNQIAIRGHTILWADKKMTQSWVKSLPAREVLKAAVWRVGSIVSRYSSNVIAWDVMNENMHNSYYEDILGPNASAMFYQITRALDPEVPLFLNEYNTLEYPRDMDSIPSKYVEKIKEIRSFVGSEQLNLRIGLQGHFWDRPNVSYIRAALDILGATNIPIWLTELDTGKGPTQAAHLEEVMREAFSHPAVEGIIVWGGWKPTNCNETCLAGENYDFVPKGCAKMCLVDKDLNNLPPGDVLDKLIREWMHADVKGVTDENGVFEHRVFFGEHSIGYSHQLIPGQSGRVIVNVGKEKEPLDLWVSL